MCTDGPLFWQEEQRQLVLPAAHIQTVLQAQHNDMGHLGERPNSIFATGTDFTDQECTKIQTS